MWVGLKKNMDFTCLQVEEVEYSETTLEELSQSERSSMKRIKELYYSADKEMECCLNFQYGTMLEHFDTIIQNVESILNDSEELEIDSLSQVDSLAKILALREKEQGLAEKEAGYGLKWLELLARYDLQTSSLKTLQCSFLEDWTESSVTLPKWGTLHNGELWELMQQELDTRENGFGYFLPTTRASMYKHSKWYNRKNPRGNLEEIPAIYREYAFLSGKRINLDWMDWHMIFPVGWTGLKPLEMDKFQQWLELHKEY